MPLTAVVADDHSFTRQTLCSLLPAYNVEVVGTADDGTGVLPLLQEHGPTLLVLDLSMPNRSGLDVLQDLKALADEGTPAVDHVIVFSMEHNQAYVDAAFRLGADAFVLKGHDAAELGHAIEAVRNGETYVSEAIASSS